MIIDNIDHLLGAIADKNAGDSIGLFQSPVEYPSDILVDFAFEAIKDYGIAGFILNVGDVLSCYAADKLAVAGEAAKAESLLAARDRYYPKEEGEEAACLPGRVSEQQVEFYRQIEPLKEPYPPFWEPSDEEHPKAVMIPLFEHAATESGILALMVSIRDLLTWHIVAGIQKGDEPSRISRSLEIRDRFYPQDDTWNWKTGVWELPGAYAWYEYPPEAA